LVSASLLLHCFHEVLTAQTTWQTRHQSTCVGVCPTHNRQQQPPFETTAFSAFIRIHLWHRQQYPLLTALHGESRHMEVLLVRFGPQRASIRLACNVLVNRWNCFQLFDYCM
jgi:hypothetical protein